MQKPSKFEALFDELISQQKKTMRCQAEKYVANITDDDLLQPNDFSELESNPFFRYEEGVLHGLQAAKTAVNALMKENPKLLSFKKLRKK